MHTPDSLQARFPDGSAAVRRGDRLRRPAPAGAISLANAGDDVEHPCQQRPLSPDGDSRCGGQAGQARAPTDGIAADRKTATGAFPAGLTRRHLLTTAAAIPALAITSHTSAQDATPAATPIATPGGTPAAGLADTPWADMAEAMWATIREQLWHDGIGQYLERTPRQDNDIATLWPVCALFSGLRARAEAGTSPDAMADLAGITDHLGEYFDAGFTPPGYDSYPRSRGGGDKFYDDNEWLGIDAVYAHRLSGEQRHLDLALTTWDFAISGWSDDLGGGIFWQENDRVTKNTCSNGPAAVLAMLLHEETGDQQYLDWAVRIMDWTRQLRDPVTGVYLDHIRLDGTIDDRTFTYNTGTPLHAAALLHRATGDAAYLDEARSLATAAWDHFAPAGSATDDTLGLRPWPADPWFNAILFRGYVALAEVSPDPEDGLTPTRAMLDFLRLGWARARDEDGLVLPDWSQQARGPALIARLLDQAPILEFAATAHRLDL